MIPTAQYPDNDCLGMTYTIYFFLMASFSWMVVMSYDVWRLFKLENIGNNNLKRSIKRKVLRRYKWYGIGAWGVPAVLTAFLIVTNHINLRHIPSFITPNIPEFGCFISGGEKKLYMYIPMLILILINWVFFILTSYNLWSQYKNTSSLDMKDANKNISNQDHRSFKYKFFTYVRLSILSGLSWILEMASSYSPNVSFWIVTDCYNMLTGFFIFLILVCNKRTYEQLRKRVRNKCGCAEYTFFAHK
ncbi:7 transmembrane receptor (Secretin family) domain-containing protein [Phthorimaea operculella]|nr:7 transmembrane receptor (Secretin family) domain-containing protein [Phthorimaea operculella]